MKEDQLCGKDYVVRKSLGCVEECGLCGILWAIRDCVGNI